MKNRFLLLAVALFSLILMGGAAFAGNPEIESVNYDPSPVEPGQPFTLWVSVKNDSSLDSTNMVFELDLSGGDPARTNFPFYLGKDDSPRREVKTVKPYNTHLFQYKVYVDGDALDGEYAIDFRFGDFNKILRSQPYTITVLSRKPQIELISSFPLRAHPGETVEMNLTLKNTGSSNAINVLVGSEEDRTVTSTGVVVERQIYPLGSGFSYVSGLAPGKQATAKLMLSVNYEANIQTYLVPMTVKWQDENKTDYSVTRYLGFKVTDEPALDSIISETEPLPFPGGKTEVTVDLFNRSLAGTRNVVVEVSSEAATKINPQKIFIGSLESDDFDSFKTDIWLKPGTQPGEHPLNLKISYRGSDNEELVLETSLPLQVVSAAEAQAAAGGDSSGLFLLLIVVVVVGFWWWRRRKKKKEKR